MAERKQRPLRILSLLLPAVVLLAGVIFTAAADDGKPRYVSGDGRDVGDCRNRFRPCRTLSYAIAQAGKGDLIHVAEGTYTISDAKQLYDVLSVKGRLNGGFTKVSGYSERTATGDTVLVGVPPEFRERFEAAGFTVIVDTKGLQVSREESQRMRKLSVVIAASERSHSATPCVGNVAAGFACQNVSLHAHLSFQQLRPASSRGNDVWGFIDLNTRREYAFMGLENGVAVVDVTDPQAPEQVGFGQGSSTVWRDIKVYQLYDPTAKRWRAYAYATADNVQDFLMVLDLSNLPNGVERVAFNSDFRAAHNSYIVDADYTFGLSQTGQPPRLGIAGGNAANGNHRLYSLADPRAPQLVRVSNGGYAHDLASFPVNDARKNACANPGAQGPCQVLADFNENTFDLWDVSDPASAQLLASLPYQNAAYVHSGWWTEDGRYLLVHDELDELNLGLNTTVRVFDIANLSAPVLAGSWVGPVRATDHNGYVKGNRYYISNYAEGLTVLDLSNPHAPARVGFFDTFPASSDAGFVGAWGVYPFFGSGTIAVGDINSGLYLLKNETLTTPAGSFVVSSPAISGTEGGSVTVSVSRTGGSTGAASVRLAVLHASTTAADVSLASNTLSWANGETGTKTATIDLAADGADEGMELVLVRLEAPQGGATIGYPDTAYVSVSDPGTTTTLRALNAAPTVDEARGKASVVVTRHGSASGEARVSYRTIASSSYNGFTPAQGELVWADGDTTGKLVTVQLNQTALAAGQSGTFQIELFGALGSSLESPDGTAATTLPLTITVRDSTQAAPPPPPPPSNGGGGGGGGGSMSLFAAALLLLLLTVAGRRRLIVQTRARQQETGTPARKGGRWSPVATAARIGELPRVLPCACCSPRVR